MLRNIWRLSLNRYFPSIYIPKNTFLTNDYKCTEAWNSQTSSSVLTKVNLSDFYNLLDQTYTSKGVISAIDVDVFANAVKDPAYLEELKDLLHKLRLSAETGSTLDSTQYATIRNYIEFDHDTELIDILKDPLKYGIFLDHYTSNVLLDKLLTLENYELAATVASLIMLQEDYTNEITCALCQYACNKFIAKYEPPIQEVKSEDKNKKVEEIKIRIKYLRNPYYDDHFDIKDTYTLSGKTIAWMSEGVSDNLNNNLQVIGWLVYKKYDKLLSICEKISKETTSKVYREVIELLKKECMHVDNEPKTVLENCITILTKVTAAQVSLDDSIKTSIENAINKVQNIDIANQQKLFQSWAEIREDKLDEQTKRLDRVKRMKTMQDKQKEMEKEEQKLWFFENEEAIDLEIEKKEKLKEIDNSKKVNTEKSDENYIPPEIVPKRK